MINKKIDKNEILGLTELINLIDSINFEFFSLFLNLRYEYFFQIVYAPSSANGYQSGFNANERKICYVSSDTSMRSLSFSA